MANPTRPNNTRKFVLIGVLGLILIVVLIVQFSGGGSVPTPSADGRKPTRAPRRPRGGGSKPAVAALKPTAPLVEKQWPELSRDVILGHDPFALPRQLQPVASAVPGATQVAITDSGPQAGSDPERPLDTSGLKLEGVAMGGGTAVASFGGRTFAVGDVVQGFRIVEIHPDRVVLEEAEQQQ